MKLQRQRNKETPNKKTKAQRNRGTWKHRNKETSKQRNQGKKKHANIQTKKQRDHSDASKSKNWSINQFYTFQSRQHAKQGLEGEFFGPANFYIAQNT